MNYYIMSDKQVVDPNTLLQNMYDLSDFSEKMLKEIEHKNKILQFGLGNCKMCGAYLSNYHKKISSESNKIKTNQ